MITTGKIVELAKRNDIDIYKVEVFIYNSPTKETTSTSVIFDAPCSVMPGVYSPYNVGDLVYVGFANNLCGEVIILGKIYQGLPKEDEKAAVYQYISTLKVSDKVILPEDLTIGNITWKDIETKLKTINIQEDVNEMSHFAVISDLHFAGGQKKIVLNMSQTIGNTFYCFLTSWA